MGPVLSLCGGVCLRNVLTCRHGRWAFPQTHPERLPSAMRCAPRANSALNARLLPGAPGRACPVFVSCEGTGACAGRWGPQAAGHTVDNSRSMQDTDVPRGGHGAVNAQIRSRVDLICTAREEAVLFFLPLSWGQALGTFWVILGPQRESRSQLVHGQA